MSWRGHREPKICRTVSWRFIDLKLLVNPNYRSTTVPLHHLYSIEASVEQNILSRHVLIPSKVLGTSSLNGNEWYSMNSNA
jgi:hypothetical protein